MAEDLHTYLHFDSKNYLKHSLLDKNTLEKLQSLNQFFDNLSNPENDSFWNDNNLSTNKDWIIARNKASEIIDMLNLNHLDISFERKENFSQTKEGKQLLSQATKTRLVNKNVL